MADKLEGMTTSDLAVKARAGDAAALRAVLDRCKGDPKRLIQTGRGDLFKIAVTFACKLFEKDPLNQEAIHARMDQIRADLSGADPSPLELLLIERIALCWLESHTQSILTAIRVSEGHSIRLIEHGHRCADQAERRYLRAIKVLADVRKLNLPPIQLNVAENQQVFSGDNIGRLLGRPESRSLPESP